MRAPIRLSVLPPVPAIGVVLLTCLALLGDVPVSAQCRAPHFRRGADYGRLLSVSIQKRDFSIDKLTCLAQTLRSNRRNLESFDLLFFSSHEASQRFRGIPVESGFPPRWHKWAKELHAAYSFDADKHKENLEIMPMGFGTAPILRTMLDLPLPAAPHCRLEIQNRCLMAAMEQISYPQEALKKRATGVVVLTGVIRRDGQCAGLHLQETDVKAGEDTEWLVNVAFQDLRTWQFDAADRDDAVRVTYSFAVDASLPRGVAPQVEWVSPSQVKVRANPSE